MSIYGLGILWLAYAQTRYCIWTIFNEWFIVYTTANSECSRKLDLIVKYEMILQILLM